MPRNIGETPATPPATSPDTPPATPPDPPPDLPRGAASDLALAFLDAMGARRLEEAEAMTAEGFVMIFPGGRKFRDWTALLDWAAPRYRSIAKRIARVEETPVAGGAAVYVSGALHGERPDGTPFDEVRFIDRFEVAMAVTGPRITRQEVWNDLGEFGIG